MAGKRAINLSIDSEVIDEARGLGLNLSEEAENALRRRVSEERANQWRAANREAIEEANQELGRNGLWSDGLRTF